MSRRISSKGERGKCRNPAVFRILHLFKWETVLDGFETFSQTVTSCHQLVVYYDFPENSLQVSIWLYTLDSHRYRDVNKNK